MTSPCGSTNNWVNSAYVFSTVVILKWLIMKPNRNRLHHLMLNCASGNTLLHPSLWRTPHHPFHQSHHYDLNGARERGYLSEVSFILLITGKVERYKLSEKKVWTKNFTENLKKKFRFFFKSRERTADQKPRIRRFIKTILNSKLKISPVEFGKLRENDGKWFKFG